MGLVYVLAALFLLGFCSADEMVMVDNKAYANVMLNGMTKISKQSDIDKDLNKIDFAPKNVMTTNDTSTYGDFNISNMNFTLVAAADANEQVDSRRVVGTMEVNGGMLTMHVDVFSAGGNVTMDGETTVVMEGDMRITLLVSGAFVFAEGSSELKMMFMIEGTIAPKLDEDADKTDGDAYDLGGNGMVILSKKVKVGDAYQVSTPTVSENMVTISFGKSDTAVNYMYQFFIRPADVKEETSSSTRVTSLGALAIVMTALTAMLW